MNSTRHAGFTLIELMIVVVIIGIIAAFAYPNYTRYVTETRRADGQIALTRIAALQEKFFTECGFYASNFQPPPPPAFVAPVCAGGPGTGLLGALNTSEGGNYLVAIGTNVATGGYSTNFTLTAAPLGVQAANDTDCASLTLDSIGIKGQTGPVTARCWRK
jgi:type IV pilus assembly protein PilE